MTDLLGLREPSSETDPDDDAQPWRVLVVDDDPEVHSVTKLALDGFRFAGRRLEFLHAYTGAQARRMLEEHHGVAVMLLDVVMESDGSGLEVVRFVRNELRNPFLRIVLRTGQPGQAPETEVITRYDINDYKHKTELTRERLFTTVYTSLSTYRDLVTLDASRRGLEHVIDASARIFELRSLDHFAQGVLEQLIALLLFDADALVVHASGLATEVTGELRIVAGTGSFSSLVGREARSELSPEMVMQIEQARRVAGFEYSPHHFIGVQHGSDGSDLVFYVTVGHRMLAPDRRLLEMFCRNVAIARENVRRFAANGEAQRP
jgi:CheY-like chemotaxis protein